jgi:hypothetical protein
MRILNFLLLAVIVLLASCGPAGRAELSPVRLSPTPAQQPAPFSTEDPISIDYGSPLATPTNRLAAVESSAAPPPTVVSSEAEPGGRRAVFPETIIVYQQQNGPVGDWQQWTVYHSGRIVVADGTEWQASPSTVGPLFDLVERPDFWNLLPTYKPERKCPDCLVQTVTVYYEGDIKEITVINEPPALPPHLKQVLQELDDLISP